MKVSSGDLRSGPSASSADNALYLPTLDGWRAIAIFLVLVAHATPELFELFGQQLGRSSDAFQLAGLFGVRIFLGLSGFLITTRLLRDEEQRGRIDLADFYIRRFFRIVPAAFTMLTVAGLLSLFGILQITLGRWLSQLFFFANYSSAETSYFVGHFWSLSIEEHFYFIWPGLLVILPRGKRGIVAAAGALGIAAWRAIDWKFHVTNADAAHFWARTDIQGDFLLWGAIVAVLLRDPDWKPTLLRLLASRVMRSCLVVVLLSGPFVSFAGWKTHFALLTVLGIAIPLAILTTVYRPRSLTSKLLEGSAVRWFGRLSYSVYLWQQLFLCPPELIASQMRIVQTLPLNLLAIVLCATVSHYLVETPLISLGRKIARRRAIRSKASACRTESSGNPLAVIEASDSGPSLK